MKAWPFIILSAVLLAGCSHQDPIDRLVHQVSHESVPSYPFKAIDLPATATPEQLVTSLSKRSVLDLGHFDFSSYKISEVRPVETEPPMSEKFTAVRLDTNLGQRIILFRPMDRGTNWFGWYYRIYDAK